MVLDLAIRLEVLEVLEQKVHPEHAPLNLPICSNPSGKCSDERPTRGTVCGTMRSMCGADVGCLAINCQCFEIRGLARQNRLATAHFRGCCPRLIQGLGSRVSGLGLRVSGVGLRVSGVGFRFEGLGCRVEDWGFGF